MPTIQNEPAFSLNVTAHGEKHWFPSLPEFQSDLAQATDRLKNRNTRIVEFVDKIEYVLLYLFMSL